MARLSEILLGGVVPTALILSGAYFLIRLRFFYLIHPRRAWGLLGGRDRAERRASLRSLSLALAGTLGVGNIVGVAGAIVMGGAGAIFWMWISAFFAMTLKYAEIVLAMRTRRFDGEGNPHGSAMNYIRAAFRERGFPIVGGLLAAIFAALCVVNALTMGSLLQVEAVSSALGDSFGIPRIWIGLGLSLLTLWCIRGGSHGMMRLTERLVPLMSIGYVILSVAVLIIRADALPGAFREIFEDALRPSSAVGGIGGFLTSRSVRYGTMRGLISNEAGCGTAPMAHATAVGGTPVRQGLMGVLEVFVDTLLLCTLTALVILVSPSEAGAIGSDFMRVTLSAYEAVLGTSATYFMSLAVLLFGFATVVCWAHYGLESVTYFSSLRKMKILFGAIYLGAVLWGSVADAEPIWQITDLAIGGMTLINLTALLLLNHRVEEETFPLPK